MIRVAVIGYGYWGPNLCRVLEESEEYLLVAIADSDAERRELAGRRHRTTRVVSDADAVYDRRPDLVVVATPVWTHFPLARFALEQGCHVLVSKPMTDSVPDAAELCELAFHHGRLLLVDHTFVFTGAVRRMRKLVEGDYLGRLLFVDSVRANLGLVQPDIDVVWDLAPHDVSILLHLLGRMPTHVQTVAADPIGVGRASLAYLTLWFDGGPIAHVHANWLSPVKVRRMLVAGVNLMIVYDDVEPVEKVRVFDSGVDVEQEERRVGYRTGDVWSPKLDIREALAAEVAHLAECVTLGVQSDVAGPEAGYAVVRVLAAARESQAREGLRVTV